MNDQRKVIYGQRIELMEAEDVSETVEHMRQDVVEAIVPAHIPPKAYAEEWDSEGLEKECHRIFGLHLPVIKWSKEEGIADEEIKERIDQALAQLNKDKLERYGERTMRIVEKKVLLLTLDQLWKDHLLSLDHLRQGIGLRSLGQKDPLNEYKREAFYMFEDMLGQLREVVTTRMSHMEITSEEEATERLAAVQRPMHEGRVDMALGGAHDAQLGATDQIRSRIAAEDRDPANEESWGRVKRNEACPCGSGKKYKQCHGKI